jgi:hypothetical protein
MRLNQPGQFGFQRVQKLAHEIIAASDYCEIAVAAAMRTKWNVHVRAARHLRACIKSSEHIPLITHTY